ncbi:FAD dependent oxidoreductase [Halothece sp. PCC 7418]|uniref:FAD-dependent oxidoreductase n=1 Tax=Halothece sp. (strain PCC 7418) TaxID=65093 RepID=UPI0002A08C7A|nr:NAD(P)/FAD-dependent oxidoreductase [Halothece sp. PCC 7418]AFZ42627.1 FAD dependent oxidoreductase [Halothece sp. PCC 7418]
MTDSSSNSVVIIGGGPAGLGAALMLAKRGWTNIKVIEKRPSADYYEPDKSFNYQIDGRGQKLTDLLNITGQLADLSVPNTEFYITIIKSDGTRQMRKLPIADPNRKTAYWLARPSFMRLLYDEIQEHWQEAIQVLFQTKCVELKPFSNRLEVQTQSQDIEAKTFHPKLIIGCDGLNSIVRQTLHQIEGDSHSFAMEKYPSPSSGLKYKVLTFPPQFPLSEQAGDVAKPTMAYAFRSQFKERKKAISLGLLPFKDPNQPRTANIITYNDHYIWQLETPEEVEAFLKKSFPQLPLDKIISDEEIARFTASEGGKFPIPQYCSGLYKIVGEPEKEKGTAILLLGDAVHCFPPDIGQGVNSALEDIYIFHELLAETNDNLLEALPRYQTQREEDVKALIRLVQISYPWQYNQDLLQKRLWTVNFLIRLFLHRILPFLFQPHSFLLIQNHELSYSDILAKSNRTTRLLFSLGGLGVLVLLFIVFRNL